MPFLPHIEAEVCQKVYQGSVGIYRTRNPVCLPMQPKPSPYLTTLKLSGFTVPYILTDLVLQELHAHLNGSISAATMKKLLKRYADKVSQSTEGERTAIPELWETTIAKGEKRTLDEYV